MAGRSTCIVATSSSAKLAKSLGKRLRISVIPVERTQFVNSEIRLRLRASVDTKRCLLIANFGTRLHEALFELILLGDLLQKSGAAEIIAVVPYFPYSRQHKGFRSGESESFDLLARTLVLSGISKAVTVDFHNEDALSRCPLPVANVSSLAYLAGLLRKRIDPRSSVVVSPDEGGKSRAESFASAFGSPCTFVQKTRHLAQAHTITGAKLERGSLVKGKTALIVDDISTSGQTLLAASRECTKYGAKTVVAVVVHADMSSAAKKALRTSKIERIFVTNTLETRATGGNMTVIDIAPLLAGYLAQHLRA